MSETAASTLRRPVAIQFAIGRVLSASLRILRRNFLSFFLLSAALQSVAYLEYLISWMGVPIDYDGWTYILLALLQDIAIAGFATATIAYGAFQDLRGQPASLLQSARQSVSCLVPVLGAALLYGVLVTLGVALFVIPGLVMAVVWWAYIPAIIVERRRTFDSFSRSAALTGGNRWEILGILMVCGAASWASDELLVTVSHVRILTDLNPVILTGILQHAADALIEAYGAVTVAVGYYYLRAEKEGTDIEEIASVFD
jgi:hypothetical protein